VRDRSADMEAKGPGVEPDPGRRQRGGGRGLAGGGGVRPRTG